VLPLIGFTADSSTENDNGKSGPSFLVASLHLSSAAFFFNLSTESASLCGLFPPVVVPEITTSAGGCFRFLSEGVLPLIGFTADSSTENDNGKSGPSFLVASLHLSSAAFFFNLSTEGAALRALFFPVPDITASAGGCFRFLLE